MSTVNESFIPPVMQSRVVYEKRKSGCLATFLLVFCVTPMAALLCLQIALFVMRANSPELDKMLRDEERQSENEDMAWMTAERAVKQQLNFPEEADFGWQVASENNVKPQDDGTYNVSGWVVSKNAFGVKTKYVFIVNVRNYGGGWSFVLVGMQEASN